MDVIQSQEETQPVSGFGTPGFIPLKLDKEEIDPRTYGEGTGLGNSSGGGGDRILPDTESAVEDDPSQWTRRQEGDRRSKWKSERGIWKREEWESSS